MRVKGSTILVALSVVVPLSFIAAAALLAGWFNIVNNALSDLGHATRSNVAPLFNFGLSAGGALLIVVGVTCAAAKSKLIGYTLAASGFILILIAVFDEVYGRLHFYVSVAFFVSLAVLLAEYAILKRGIRAVLASLAIMVGVASWVLHLYYGIPPGAAIPELISIAVASPFYIDFVLGKGGE